ncbi:MAG: hypothetical protein A3G34_13720 [Candidatus Lindowbacteria bacterium RIFCSPLOWO2_12_FULL_62_27]|nr:MAG: hypothetical protein A3I06_12575 [Candidatus Lindowbacteria bacterium RIFCSPLOWO2_02_FULL_62_12]OGH62637.1 MAG: hypothetical protein A3G34_13720 [Candidatus Lindowbacteria bacterium RIFCSPLOWO2_12_FULL_62_27]
MSLKAFHRFFITVAILFCVWFAVAEYREFTRSGSRSAFYVSVSVGATAATLLAYFVWFLRKSKKWPMA